MEVLGLPEMEYLNQSTKKRNFFDSDDNPRIFSTRGRIRHPGTKQVRRVLIGADEEFIDFIEGCL